MSVLAVSGDIGGQKALIPVLEKMYEQNIDFKVIEHRGLGEISDFWVNIGIDSENEGSWSRLFKENNIEVLIFSTSVGDLFPLRLAKKAKKFGIKVCCLLDNWMNYRKRLELDGKVFLPDKYLLMDEIAYAGALKDGLPGTILEITGQPALTAIQHSFESVTVAIRQQRLIELGIDAKKKLIVFISEPAESDQGKDHTSPTFRGYTEKTVLKTLCRQLQQCSEKIEVAVVPHPREDKEKLLNFWQDHAGALKGGFFDFKDGREAIMLADGVAGMASILLHEAWFINKPTISLQPNATREDLLILKNRNGIVFLKDDLEWERKILKWISLVFESEKNGIRKELCFHKNAADKIIKIINDIGHQ